MIGRKQEINLQFQEILDGALLVLSFYIAHTCGIAASSWFHFAYEIPDFNQFRWVLFVLMPFGPIILEMQGYYNHVLQKDGVAVAAATGPGGVVAGAFDRGLLVLSSA